MVLNVEKSFIDGLIRIKQTGVVATGRRLQENMVYTVAEVRVTRFDAYDEQEIESVEAFGMVFTVLAWVGLVTIVGAVASGFGVVV